MTNVAAGVEVVVVGTHGAAIAVGGGVAVAIVVVETDVAGAGEVRVASAVDSAADVFAMGQ